MGPKAMIVLLVCSWMAMARPALTAQTDPLQDLRRRIAEMEKQGKLDEALEAAKEALNVASKTSPVPWGPDVISAMNDLAIIYQRKRMYAEAAQQFEGIEGLGEFILEERPNQTWVALIYQRHGDMLANLGKYANAQPLFERALEIYKTASAQGVQLSTNDEQGMFNAMIALGGVYIFENKNQQAETVLLNALKLGDKKSDQASPAIAVAQWMLGDTLNNEGRLSDAEERLLSALKIQDSVFGLDNPASAHTLKSLLTTYWREGKFSEADQALQRAIAMKSLAQDPGLAGALFNELAEFDGMQGKYKEAEAVLVLIRYAQEQALREDNSVANNSVLVSTLNNLGKIYHSEGSNKDAQRVFQEALEICQKSVPHEQLMIANLLNNLGIIYGEDKNFGDSEKTLVRARDIREKSLGPNDTSFATSLDNLGMVYWLEDKFEMAADQLKRALAIKESALGADHPDVATVQLDLATVFTSRDMVEEATPLFDRGIATLRRLLRRQYTYMTEKERIRYTETLRTKFNLYLSFCMANKDKGSMFAGRMYDASLDLKGLVAQTISSLRTQIIAEGDASAISLLNDLAINKAQLSALLNARPPNLQAWQRSVSEMTAKIDQQEKDLARLSNAFAESQKQQDLTWQDVQRSLRKDEAAVEFLRFRFVKASPLKPSVDAVYYVALALRSSPGVPVVVPLGEAKTLEGDPIDDYRQYALLQGRPTTSLGRQFQRSFWKPLEPVLAGIKHVYLSPDGILNEVSWAAVPTDDGSVLADQYDIDVVLSTKEVAQNTQQQHRSAANAILIGDPRFNLSEQELIAAVKTSELKSASSSTCPSPGDRNDALSEVVQTGSSPERTSTNQAANTQAMASLAPLGNTRKEVATVASLLIRNKWEVGTYCGQYALEEAIKRNKGPRLVHVATHGFFEPDEPPTQSRFAEDLPINRKDPMLRSGLYFAGAELTRKGSPPKGVEDGVLTAYEAMELNLQGTELVVLSACDTGLGEIQNGEGVFGLRRALQEAGAQAVLMSMWPIPDEETEMLMTLFYQAWLSGSSKQVALRKAQRALRDKLKAKWNVDLPYYWAAFVLVGQ